MNVLILFFGFVISYYSLNFLSILVTKNRTMSNRIKILILSTITIVTYFLFANVITEILNIL